MRCTTHAATETALTCAECGKPYCHRCLYHTDVGAKCRRCARLRRLPTYAVPWPFYARALGAAAALSGAAGVVWGYLWSPFYTVGIVGIVLWIGTGYLIGEGVSRAVNRKASPYLAAIAGAGPVVAYVVSVLIYNSQHFRDAGYLDVVRLLGVIFAAVMAGGRLRH